MGLKLRSIRMVLDATEAGCNWKGSPQQIEIEAEKVKQDYDEALEQEDVEKWKVKINPRFHSSNSFDLTGGELDGILEDLVTYRGLIMKIEHILGDAEREKYLCPFCQKVYVSRKRRAEHVLGRHRGSLGGDRFEFWDKELKGGE